MMKTAIVLLFFCTAAALQAQNVETTRIPGLTHYEHKFIEEHRIGDVGTAKYPHIQIYCRSNDSDMVIFKLIVDRQGAFAIGSAESTPVFDCDGDIWKGTNVTYESFPLKNGVIETFEFYAPMLLMEMLGNSDEVVLDIEGARYTYPAELRNDYKELYKTVKDRHKNALVQKPRKTKKPSFK